MGSVRTSVHTRRRLRRADIRAWRFDVSNFNSLKSIEFTLNCEEIFKRHVMKNKGLNIW